MYQALLFSSVLCLSCSCLFIALFNTSRLLGHAKVETVKSKGTLHRKGASKKRWWPFGWFVIILIAYVANLLFSTSNPRYWLLLKTKIFISSLYVFHLWNGFGILYVLVALRYLLSQGCIELFIVTLGSELYLVKMLFVEFLTLKY